MRNDTKGRFVSILPSVMKVFRSQPFQKDRWMYFSAYPENVPPDCELSGMQKMEHKRLIEVLFIRLREEFAWI